MLLKDTFCIKNDICCKFSIHIAFKINIIRVGITRIVKNGNYKK